MPRGEALPITGDSAYGCGHTHNVLVTCVSDRCVVFTPMYLEHSRALRRAQPPTRRGKCHATPTRAPATLTRIENQTPTEILRISHSVPRALSQGGLKESERLMSFVRHNTAVVVDLEILRISVGSDFRFSKVVTVLAGAG